MKTLNNSNLTLNQVLQSIVSQSVNDILIQEGIKSGDGNPVKGLTDVKKKGAKGTIVGTSEGNSISIRLDDGQVVEVEVDRGWYFLWDDTTTANQEVEVDFDKQGVPYIIATSIPPKNLYLRSNGVTKLTCGNYNGIHVYPDVINIGNIDDDNKGGLVMVEELTSKLNDLIKSINQLVTIFNSHTHTVISPGLPTSTTSALQTVITNRFNKADYENTKIVQYK